MEGKSTGNPKIGDLQALIGGDDHIMHFLFHNGSDRPVGVPTPAPGLNNQAEGFVVIFNLPRLFRDHLKSDFYGDIFHDDENLVTSSKPTSSWIVTILG